MITDVPTNRSSGLYLLYGPRFFPSAACRFEHVPIRWGNTSRRNGERQRSFGIGESICGLEESQKDHEHSTGEFSTLRVLNPPVRVYSLHAAMDNIDYVYVVHDALTVKIIRKFCVLKFRGWWQLRKYFNENFPIYGSHVPGPKCPAFFLFKSWMWDWERGYTVDRHAVQVHLQTNTCSRVSFYNLTDFQSPN